MRKLIALAACLALATAACGKKDDAAGAAKTAESGEAKPGTPAAPEGKGPEVKAPEAKPAAKGPDYAAIDALVAAAKTGDEFTNLIMECGKLEIDAAMNGNDKLGEDDNHVEHCKVAPAKARAKLAIAESTPDKMSTHCLSAAMNLDELAHTGKARPELEPLLAEVNKACGL